MPVRIRLAVSVLGASLIGCGQPDPPPADHSRPPDPKNPAPYVSKGHKNAIEKPNPGPTQANPREKAPPR